MGCRHPPPPPPLPPHSCYFTSSHGQNLVPTGLLLLKKFSNHEQWIFIYTTHCSSRCIGFNIILFSPFPIKNKIRYLSSLMSPSTSEHLSTKSEVPSFKSVLYLLSFADLSLSSLSVASFLSDRTKIMLWGFETMLVHCYGLRVAGGFGFYSRQWLIFWGLGLSMVVGCMGFGVLGLSFTL